MIVTLALATALPTATVPDRLVGVALTVGELELDDALPLLPPPPHPEMSDMANIAIALNVGPVFL